MSAADVVNIYGLQNTPYGLCDFVWGLHFVDRLIQPIDKSFVLLRHKQHFLYSIRHPIMYAFSRNHIVSGNSIVTEIPLSTIVGQMGSIVPGKADGF